jgi:hypothetical protein
MALPTNGEMKMNRLSSGVLACVVLLSTSSFLYAQQRPRELTEEEAAAAAAAGAASCAGCGLVGILVPIVLLALNIALLVWVARDSKSRAMDSAVLWMILVMFTGPIGLLIYLFSRPQGNLVQCASCRNKRLQASAKCPHCGNA